MYRLTASASSNNKYTETTTLPLKPTKKVTYNYFELLQLPFIKEDRLRARQIPMPFITTRD